MMHFGEDSIFMPTYLQPTSNLPRSGNYKFHTLNLKKKETCISLRNISTELRSFTNQEDTMPWYANKSRGSCLNNKQSLPSQLLSNHASPRTFTSSFVQPPAFIPLMWAELVYYSITSTSAWCLTSRPSQFLVSPSSHEKNMSLAILTRHI